MLIKLEARIARGKIDINEIDFATMSLREFFALCLDRFSSPHIKELTRCKVSAHLSEEFLDGELARMKYQENKK